MNWLRRIIAHLRGPDFSQAYCDRFIAPHVERARAAGISQTELDEFWAMSLKLSSAETPPGWFFRNRIDNWIYDHERSEFDDHTD
jgi:hypothetical protein